MWKCVEHEKMFDCSVGGDGCVVALSESEAYPYIWDGKEFLQLPNPMRLRQISVGSKNNIMGVKPDGSCWKFDNASETWKEVPGKNIAFISCSADACWAVDTAGRALQLMKDGWYDRGHRSGAFEGFIDISVASNGVVYAVDEHGHVLHWDSQRNNWVDSPKMVRKGMRNVTALDNDQWMGIDEDGKLVLW
jgi:hypothetical protein